MRVRRVTRVMKAVAAGLGVAAGLVVASHTLGGPVRVVVLEGSSMEPSLHGGDLVLVRRSSTYGPGDAVAYRSEDLDAIVLHRIVEVEDGRYTFKGDNNGWLDPERPTAGQLLGERWIRVPGAGRALGLLQTPLGSAALAGGGALVLFGGTVATARRRRGRGANQTATTTKEMTMATRTGPASIRQHAVVVCAVALAASVVLGTLAVVAPERTVTRPAFRHVGEFSYAADAPAGAAYQDGQVSTGDVVFRTLVHAFDVRFAYRFDGEEPAGLRGEGSLVAEVSDGNGWAYGLELAPPVRFEGTEAILEGRLDLDGLARILRRLERQTGSTNPMYDIEVIARVEVEGTVAGRTVQEVFAPGLRFQLDSVRLTPVVSEDGAPGMPALTPEKEGELVLPAGVRSTVSIWGMEVPVRFARTAAIAVGSLSALALVLLGLLARRDRQRGQLTQIVARHGHLLTPIAEASGLHWQPTVDVASFDALAALATQYGRPVLHEDRGAEHVFSVSEDGLVYRYRVAEPSPGASPEALLFAAAFAPRDSVDA